MKIKHFLTIVLAFFGILLIGEFYIEDQTESLYHSGSIFFLNTEKETDYETLQEIAEEMNDICQKYNILMYIANSNQPTLLTGEISVYCFDDTDQYLLEKINTVPGNCRSIMSGEQEISFYSIKELDYIDIDSGFLLFGDNIDAESAYAEIKESYDTIAMFPASYDNDLTKKVLLLAVFSGLIVMIVGAFQSVNSKRITAIKIMMGYSPAELIIKQVLKDILLFAAYFTAAVLVFGRVSSVEKCHREIFILFLSISLSDLLPYLMFTHMNINSTIKGKSESSKVLLFGYIVNIPIVLICIVSVSAFLNTLNESRPFLKAERFYSNSKAVLANLDMDFFGDDPIDAHENYGQYNEDIYRNYYDKAVMISCIDIDDDFQPDTVYVNSNGKDLLFEMIPQLSEYSFDSDYTIFRRNDPAFRTEDALELISNSDFDSEYDLCDSLFSHNEYHLPFDYSIVGIDQNADSNFTRVTNPMLIINNTHPKVSNEVYSVNKGDLYNTIMYEFTDADIEAIKRDYSFYSMTITKVSEQFNYSWHYTKTKLLLFGMLSCGIVFFEISILIFIIRNDFIINGVELCLYKLHGYSIIERFSFQWIASLSTIIIETVILSVLSVKYEFISTILPCKHIIVVGLALFVFETIFIFYKSIKFEKNNICSILKGGAI